MTFRRRGPDRYVLILAMAAMPLSFPAMILHATRAGEPGRRKCSGSYYRRLGIARYFISYARCALPVHLYSPFIVMLFLFRRMAPKSFILHIDETRSDARAARFCRRCHYAGFSSAIRAIRCHALTPPLKSMHDMPICPVQCSEPIFN